MATTAAKLAANAKMTELPRSEASADKKEIVTVKLFGKYVMHVTVSERKWKKIR